MRWYLESSHYSRELGDLILGRVLGRPTDGSAAQSPGAGEFGVPIDTHNIDLHLRRTWFDAERYREAFPADVEEVQRIAGFVRRVARK